MWLRRLAAEEVEARLCPRHCAKPRVTTCTSGELSAAARRHRHGSAPKQLEIDFDRSHEPSDPRSNR